MLKAIQLDCKIHFLNNIHPLAKEHFSLFFESSQLENIEKMIEDEKVELIVVNQLSGYTIGEQIRLNLEYHTFPHRTTGYLSKTFKQNAQTWVLRGEDDDDDSYYQLIA